MQRKRGAREPGQQRTLYQRARLAIMLGFGVALILLGWATYEAYRQSRTTAAGGERVDHTLRVLNTALQLETTLLSMEVEHRAFLVRGDAALAAARDTHARLALDLLRDLAVLVRDNPTQAPRIARIEALLGERRNAMNESTTLVQNAGVEAGRDNFRPQGEGSIEPIRALLGEMRVVEERLLEQRSRQAIAAAQRLRWALLYGPGAGLGAMLLGFLALLRMLHHADAMRRQLAQANALQTAMFQSAGPMLIATAPDGRITLFNRAASEKLGYRPEQMIDKLTPAVFHDADEIAERAVTLARELGTPVAPGFEVFTTLPERGTPEERVWTYVRSDASRFPVQLVVSALRDEGGTLLGFLGVAQDISERVAAERAIRDLNAALLSRTRQLEDSVRDLESFSYSVSHDLRAPLRHVDGYARMLAEDAGDALDAECRRYIREIGTSAQRMGRLIDDLLSLSRLGRTPLQRAPVDMNALVRDACRELDWHGQPDSVIEISRLPPCVGDSSLLRQVWVNLLSNAIKYSAPRGAAAQIQVDGSRNGDRVRYRVADNGVGFDMRFSDKLFGVFQRLHAQDEFEGTGVGLAIVQRVVARHGGSVDARGQPGAGAEFSFELPLEAPA
ncbi:sensor histidine kinase [Chiayiivirga flava]|uniref:histidine kinase n=1 Tax=Chiayiivirga flava TaxID=659595 RepID=A0A7W8D528_9GAMM|nr:ATP-binding protein [Chiayiivirga flava]MBB5208078.1 PAS domain S-box-containing protein [Chiayiivirga flava]